MEDKNEIRKLPDRGSGAALEGAIEQTEDHTEVKAGDVSSPLHGSEQDGTASLSGVRGDTALATLLPLVQGQAPDCSSRRGVGLQQAFIFLAAFVAGTILSCFVERQKLEYKTINQTYSKEKEK